MTVRRRVATPDERALFLEIFEGKKPPPPAKPASKAETPPVPPASRKPPLRPGLDGNTANRLRRGTIEPDARLDLHGHTVESAHRALVAFIRAAQKGGARLTLIVTGKGERSADPHAPFDLGLQAHPRGTLRKLTPRWLAEPALAPLVADVRSAHRRHGGDGALYVYLRKHPR